ncbi:GNAT family N-acetyltransferase [Alkaliphilus hydrothermalis]|nr:GNAT family N-acetyltransferase [Alkaliphilus hydrothermalis]
MAVLYIKEKYRGKGIGMELQNFLLDCAKELGLDEICLFSEAKFKDDYSKKAGISLKKV